jgi:hypothetical protein
MVPAFVKHVVVDTFPAVDIGGRGVQIGPEWSDDAFDLGTVGGMVHTGAAFVAVATGTDTDTVRCSDGSVVRMVHTDSDMAAYRQGHGSLLP